MSRARFLKLSATGFLGLMSLNACLKPDFGDEENLGNIRVICLADLHSSHRHFPRIINFIEQTSQQSKDKLLVLINGDIFESSNKVAIRSRGALEWYFLERLSKMAQVVVNLGNHEGGIEDDFRTVADNLRKLDIAVLSSIKSSTDGRHLGAPAISLMQNNQLVRIIGLSCSNQAAYRPVHRNRWIFPDPAGYLRENTGSLLHNGAVHIVMNHDGLITDKEILNLMPVGSIFLGGHDHLRAHSQTHSHLALHTSWGGHLCDVIDIGAATDKDPRSYAITTVEFDEHLNEDEPMVQMIRSRETQHLSTAERDLAGAYNQRVTPTRFLTNTVTWFRQHTKTDAVFINNTTFGPVLPNGKVRYYDIENTIRFDSRLFATSVRGSQLKTICARSNQFNNFSWEERTGEFVVGVFPSAIDPFATYRIAVNEWVAQPDNQLHFLGINDLHFEELTHEPSMREIVAIRLPGHV
ncbi:MAG: metallophosphoesterase [Candidatus Cyclonatronum sp.]|uniref:5'-nucleotidase C-terminal domain-containing protein n=1 Tax=Cyclonatronum sp. TaxID=3024185 RepID=UPI0025C5FAAF|nr:metallophosphoesterase [Cyclonatronum sp.]MCH8487415.1 metallophosphoesterase [Cyclonatronum sp.]